MTTDDLKHLYRRDKETGCRHWAGPGKVRYMGRTWYPHILLWYLTKQPPIPQNKVLVRTCDSEDCISPEHRKVVPRQYYISGNTWTKQHNPHTATNR